MNLFHNWPLTPYDQRPEHTTVTLIRQSRTPLTLALCTLILASCGSNGVGQPSQIGTTPTLEVSAAQPASTTEITELPTQQNNASPSEFIEVIVNERMTCTASIEEFEATFLTLLNNARAEPRQCGTTSHEPAPEIRWNDSLHTAAVRHSIDMTENDFFSHTGSDSSSVADRVDAAGYPWQTVGENIAAGQRTAKEAMDGWLSSPGHCRNIMNPEYRDFAVTCVQKTPTEYTTYWTNVFGTKF